ncbi:MAG: aminotransferase class I/II-fold pyridoxal phosphate-dependent enzyme, partial [Acidobacteria bacterium]|nr:aminotransferase class I/II-fold pyridoxal phosphate-dependent enzyme [Acidobacteriota bacterium]
MSDLLQRVNAALEAEAPSLARALSPLGRRMFLPAGIPVQAQEAKGCAFNGTIGLITDGHGHALPLPSMAAALALDEADVTPAFLYSPVTGLPELRRRWRQWQRKDLPAGSESSHPSSLPAVTCGLSHSLSILADLFAGEGKAVIIPAPYWGNYNHVFGTRTGSRQISAPAFREGVFNHRIFEEAAEADPRLQPGEPVLAILNLPSNPGGYSLTDEEREKVRDSLLRLAEQRPVVVICDDAYAGLVFEEEISPRSMFWDLIGLHENLVPIKVDGATKEFSLFGGRVGFLTFPFAPESGAAEALNSKIGGFIRSTVGSPVALSQTVLLQGLRQEGIAYEVEAIRQRLARRYQVLKGLTADLDRDLLDPQPFNSGCFTLLELGPGVGVNAETVRRHLLEHHSTGLISVGERYIRIAHCSVAADMLEELVGNL